MQVINEKQNQYYNEVVIIKIYNSWDIKDTQHDNLKEYWR